MTGEINICNKASGFLSFGVVCMNLLDEFDIKVVIKGEQIKTCLRHN